LKYHLEIYESMPFIELMFLATVPMPCADCLLTLPIASHVGLTVSNCSITLLPDTYTTLRIRAMPTAGANARIVPLTFGAIDAAGTPWDGLQVHTILVQCNTYFTCSSRCSLFVYMARTISFSFARNLFSFVVEIKYFCSTRLLYS